MFFHKHPYEPFIKEDTEKLIVGTLPPPRFVTGELQEKDVDFCYGSYTNSLWHYIDRIHDLRLKYENTYDAILERKNFLIKHKIGVCDIVDSCERDKIDASDLGMKNIQLRDLIGYLKQFPKVHTLLFTGGNSKNGPEYFFRKHLKEYDLKLEILSDVVPRVHQFELHPDVISTPLNGQNKPTNNLVTEQSRSNRIIKTVSLTSASGSANRAIGGMKLFKKLKNGNPKFTTFDFRLMQYRSWF